MSKLRFVPLLLLLILFGLLVLSVRALSFTVDEPAHIAVGYALLTRGKAAFWMLPVYGHPPLLNVLEAALLYLEKPDIPLERLPGWSSGDYMRYLSEFALYLAPAERTEVAARMPVVWLTVLLGALIYRWGRELGRPLAGLIALVVLCFDPNLLAHGALATTDAGTVTLGTASLYLVWRWLKFPSWKRAVGWGILLGLTMLAKVSGLIWAGAIGLIGIWKALRSPPNRRRLWLVQGALGGLMALGVLWAGHGVTWGPVQGMSGTWPAPAYWNALIVQVLSRQGLVTFALGTVQTGSRWWYFPLAFMVKTPLPLFLALVLVLLTLLAKPGFRWRLGLRIPNAPCTGMISQWRNVLSGLPEHWTVLGGFSLLYALAAIAGGMNIG